MSDELEVAEPGSFAWWTESSEPSTWSFIYRPVVRPQDTPIFEQLVSEVLNGSVQFDQPEAPPAAVTHDDPMIGTP